jgi:RNA polymerase subunit RPABC4/transcription elongation factor Spt4
MSNESPVPPPSSPAPVEVPALSLPASPEIPPAPEVSGVQAAETPSPAIAGIAWERVRPPEMPVSRGEAPAEAELSLGPAGGDPKSSDTRRRESPPRPAAATARPPAPPRPPASARPEAAAARSELPASAPGRVPARPAQAPRPGMDSPGVACGACGNILAADAARACPTCGTVYHPDCWNRSGGCVAACAGTPARTAPGPAPPGDLPVAQPVPGPGGPRCHRCGKPVQRGARRCPSCGHMLVRTEEERSGLATLALVLGVVGLAPICPLFSILAIILGSIASRLPIDKGRAATAVVLGWIGLGIHALAWLGLFRLSG